MDEKLAKVRDVDWSLVEGADVVRPTIHRVSRGRIEELVLLSRRLPQEGTIFELSRLAIEGVRSVLQLDRAAIFVKGPGGRWMEGMVGTSASGHTVDERHLRHAVDVSDLALEQSALVGERCFEVFDDAPLVAHDREQTRVIGRGWFAKTAVVSRREGLGIVYNDNGLSGRPYDAEAQQLLAAFFAMVADLFLAARQRLQRTEGAPPLIRQTLELLRADLTLTNRDVASQLGVSARRLSEEFRAQRGRSLVDVRNELRLERFFQLLEETTQAQRRVVLLDLALEAGFGSYAQFHRVFSNTLGHGPRVHLQC